VVAGVDKVVAEVDKVVAEVKAEGVADEVKYPGTNLI
jgi:hypothetical protein